LHARLVSIAFLLICLVALNLSFAQEDSTPPVAAVSNSRRSLWVADDTGISEFAPESLKKTGAPQPITVLSGGLGGGVQLDSAGDLWGLFLAGGPNDSWWVFEMTPSDLRQYRITHNFSPTVSIFDSGSTVSYPQVFKLDPSGNVWLLGYDNSGGQQIVEYAKNQFGSSVAPQPAVTLKPSGVYPTSIEFDRSGNLWMSGSTNTVNGGVMKLSSDQLTSSGSPTPVLVVANQATDDSLPFALTFDRQGNLWTLSEIFPTPATAVFDHMQRIRKKDLSGSGTITPDPAVTLYLGNPGIISISDLAFDQNGNLWLDGSLPPSAQKLTSKQIKKNGTVRPRVVLNLDGETDDLDTVRSLTFGPRN